MLLILEHCLLDLSKQGKKFDKNKLFKFFCLWPDFHDFTDEIFSCL